MGRTTVLWMLGLLASETAVAGGGPWTLSPDDRSVYVAGGYTRWRTIATGTPGETMDVGSTITRTELTSQLTYGLVRGTEFELNAGLAWAGVGEERDELCNPADTCATSLGLLPVLARAKVRLLDEFTAPLSLSAGLALRFGDFTRDGRNRLTALGDGQTDLGLFLAAGRLGGLGGSWSYGTYLQLDGRLRLAVAEVKGSKAPADELAATGEFLVYPTPNVSFGPAFDVLHALGGTNLGDVAPTNPDRFTSLAVTSVKIGGKLNIRSTDNVTVALSAFATAYAKNNPIDFFTLGFGVGTFTPAKRVDG